MIINSQRTLYGLEFQANGLINEPYVPRINTTLNEKYNLLPNEPIGADTVYGIKYLSIGTGGTPVATGSGVYSYSEHGTLDAALFNQIPFVVRTVANDLTALEQAKYRFRIPITINGINYVQYYLRRLQASDITTDTYDISVSNAGAEQLTLFTTDTPKYLNPVPRASPSPLNENNQYVSKMIKLRFSLTPTELDEINAGIAILYGPTTVLHITEIGVCSGLDKTIGTLIEALKVQIFFHISVDVDTKLRYDQTVGYLRSIELGGSEPVYV